MARCTAARACGLTCGEPLTTRDTVPRPTPARAATWSSVGGLPDWFIRFLPGKAVVPDDLTVPMTAAFDDASLRRVVNVHQAEPLAVAPAPLEVVQQRPYEITLQRYPLRDRLAAGAQVCGEVRRPVGVV